MQCRGRLTSHLNAIAGEFGGRNIILMCGALRMNDKIPSLYRSDGNKQTVCPNRMFSVRSANINGALRSASLTRLLGYLISTGCTGTPGINAPSGQGRQRTDRNVDNRVSLLALWTFICSVKSNYKMTNNENRVTRTVANSATPLV